MVRRRTSRRDFAVRHATLYISRCGAPAADRRDDGAAASRAVAGSRAGEPVPRAAAALDEIEEEVEEEPDNACLTEDERLQTADPLKLYVRQIGDGRLLTPAEERELARRKDLGDERGEAPADRVQPAARHVDHAQLHEGRRAAPRPDPGGEPRPDPRRREVRLPDGLQALDLRDLVDPPGGHACARRPGPHDPPAGARRRAGAARPALAPAARPEAEPRPVDRGDREGRGIHRASACRSSSTSSRTPSRSRRRWGTGRAWSPT